MMPAGIRPGGAYVQHEGTEPRKRNRLSNIYQCTTISTSPAARDNARTINPGLAAKREDSMIGRGKSFHLFASVV